MTIKRFGPVSCAKIAGVIYAGIGLLIGAMFSLVAVVGMALSGTQRGLAERAVSPLAGAVMGLGAIIICPILYGAMGFVSALIGAWLYNLVALRVGGIEIDIS
jgi:hypothetical protein